jgi:hypothetical protein
MYNKLFTFVLLIFFTLTLISFAADKPEYVGSTKCKTCHKAEKNGQQYKLWTEKKHAQAYKDLKSDNAKEKAKVMGVKDPLKDEKCLSCHSTAYGKKNIAKSFKIEDGVSCEACHGPGSLYKKSKVMKDKKASIAAGMLEATEATCKECHKADTPGHKGKFKDFKTEYAKIAHPVPPENDRRKK